MTFARVSALPKGFGRAVFRRAGNTSRNRSWRQVGRRGYASDHGHGQQQSSEIPWIIGSAAVTIPAAGWLIQQGPKKSEHGHDSHGEEHEEATEDKDEEQSEEANEDDSKDESKDEGKDESKEETKDEGEDESKEEEKDQSEDQKDEKEESSDDKPDETNEDGSYKKKPDDGTRQMSEDGYELPGPNAPGQINKSNKKGPGEQQKGERAPTEKQDEKSAQGNHSGAKHPYLNDPEKSKKGAGVTETAKIHGTVDPFEGARGVKDSGSGNK